MKSHRKITARVKKRNLNNPSGFKFLKHDPNLGIGELSEFHDGGASHNATPHPHEEVYDYSKVPGIGTDIPGYSEPFDYSKVPGLGTNIPGYEAPKPKVTPRPKQTPIGDFNLKPTEMSKVATDTTLNTGTPDMNMGFEDMYLQEAEADKETSEGSTQFFNPYAGVDVMGAANVFGQELGKPKGEKDPLAMVSSGLKVATGLGRSMAAGAGYAKRNQFTLDEFNKKRRSGMLEDPTALGEDGGLINFEDGGENIQMSMGIEGEGVQENSEILPELLTGDYSTGTQNAPSNIEVEKEEYIKTPDGNVTKVLGKSHENGGESMNVEKGTQIISNNLKPNKSQIQRLNEEYGVQVKSKDTYAKVMDKFYNTIGLSDLIEEEAQIIDSIKTQTEKSKEEGADESTFQINLEFLSSRLKDITDEKQPLEQQATKMFDEVFTAQESTKPEDKVQTEFKIGGTVYTKADIEKLAKTNNLDVNKAFDILNSFEQGGSFANDGLDTDKNGVDQERIRFNLWVQEMRDAGYKGDVDLEAEDLGVEAGKIQAWMVENHPEAVVEFFKTNPITSKGIKELQNSDKGRGVFEALGLDPNKAPGTYTPKERIEIQNAARQAGAVSREFILNQFNDNLWDYRNPLAVTPRTLTKNITQDLQPEAINLNSDFMPDNLKGFVNNKENAAVWDSTEAPTTTSTEGNVGRKGVYLLPDQSALPPTGMQPHLKAKRRFGRIDAQQITPDAQLTELNRNTAAAMEKISALPSGQREAAIIQLEANKQSQEADLLSKIEAANAQSRQTADAFNIRQGDREEEAKWADLLNYEQRSLGALANTEDDYRRYFNTQQQRNVANFNTINSLNLMNAMHENFDITNDGVKVTGKGPTAEDFLANLQAKAALNNPNTETNKKTTSSKKRYGGTVRRGRKK